MKHSPGTWKYALAFENNAPNYYAVTNGEWGAPTIAKCTNEADARLITAAPGLLEALEGLLADVEQLSNEFSICAEISQSGYGRKARTALAKARGK